MKNRILAAIAATAIFAAPAVSAAEDAPVLQPIAAPVSTTYVDCADVSIPVYFAPGQTELSSFAQRAIEASTADLGNCKVVGVRTAARAADAETPEQAEILTAARTDAVIAALIASGVDAERAGIMSDAVMPVNASAPLPSDRAVMVTLELGGPAHS